MPSQYGFPEHFPDDCPPFSAVDAGGVVFRVVAGEHLTEEAFSTYHELNKAPRAPACSRCAVSVFDTFRNACHLVKLKPSIGDHVARGILSPAAGKMSAPARSGHMDWWPYAGADRRSFFAEPVPCH